MKIFKDSNLFTVETEKDTIFGPNLKEGNIAL